MNFRSEARSFLVNPAGPPPAARSPAALLDPAVACEYRGIMAYGHRTRPAGPSRLSGSAAPARPPGRLWH
eukprot:413759-Hanusia_phi.AAC.2